MSSLRDALLKIEDKPKLIDAALKVMALNDIESIEDLEGATVESIVSSKATTVAVSGGLQAYLTRVFAKLAANSPAAAAQATANKSNDVTAAVADAIRLAALLEFWARSQLLVQ